MYTIIGLIIFLSFFKLIKKNGGHLTGGYWRTGGGGEQLARRMMSGGLVSARGRLSWGF